MKLESSQRGNLCDTVLRADKLSFYFCVLRVVMWQRKRVSTKRAERKRRWCFKWQSKRKPPTSPRILSSFCFYVWYSRTLFINWLNEILDLINSLIWLLINETKSRNRFDWTCMNFERQMLDRFCYIYTLLSYRITKSICTYLYSLTRYRFLQSHESITINNINLFSSYEDTINK